MANELSINIYADGGCRGNPGPGGWGVLMQAGDAEKELWGGEANTTNNAASLPVASTGAPDLVSSVVPPATLTVGTPATFTLTATNQGNLPSSDGAVTLTIPAG